MYVSKKALRPSASRSWTRKDARTCTYTSVFFNDGIATTKPPATDMSRQEPWRGYSAIITYPYKRHKYYEEESDCPASFFPSHALPEMLQFQPSCVCCHSDLRMLEHEDLSSSCLKSCKAGMAFPHTWLSIYPFGALGPMISQYDCSIGELLPS